MKLENLESKVLVIDVTNLNVREEKVKGILGPISWGLHCHLEKYESFKYDVFDEHNVLCAGIGKLAGSVIPGTQRLVFTFRSPITGGFYISSLGGGGIPLLALGIDYLVVEGRAREPVVVLLKNLGKGVEAAFEPLPREELFRIYREYRGEIGVYALERYLLEKYRDQYLYDGRYVTFRIYCVGPAAWSTRYGMIFSSVIRNGEIDVGAEDFAGRGGAGSVLARCHNVVAMLIGGVESKRTFPASDLRDVKVTDDVFNSVMGKPMSKAAFDATVKYRYDPSVGSGGTFGVNMSTLKEKSVLFNWKSIYLGKEERLRLWESLIRDHYLKQFNEEIIANKPKTFKTCGEPCPAVCKKVWGKYKKDYEPYAALGSFIGIFDQREAEKVVHTADALGYDAIYIGQVIAWVFECLEKGLLTPKDLGLDKVPCIDPENYRIEYSSMNAELAIKVLEGIAYALNDVYKVLGDGARRAAYILEEKFKDRVAKVGTRFRDLLVYTPYGKDGDMLPTMYWAPGNVMPIPIQGKYLTVYHTEFAEPEEFAQKCFTRAIKELYSEEGGLCRFHRGWGEKVLPKLIEVGYGVKVNMDEHCRELLKKIAEYNVKAGASVCFWDSRRTIDYVFTAAKEVGFTTWFEKYRRDPEATAREYWERFYSKYTELLGVKF
ncbi:MAG: glyceraldehyde-3-phosphate ferredoxin oxidoreductase [Thermoprotei archaeon]|nr:MAG: glyceraldehyde-3-phosphate ferredoxin oxidoreductase [Thermoprotei archaeon]